MARKIVLALLLGSFVAGAVAIAEIDQSLREKRFLGGGEKQNVMVSFTQSLSSVFDKINSQNFSSPTEKRTALTTAQESFVNSTQGGLQRVLGNIGVNYETFWISNKMIVPNVDSRIVSVISKVPGVAKVEKEPEFPVNPAVLGQPWESSFEENRTRTARQSAATWGVQKIRAEEVWSSYTGRDVVVANIDTGVRYTHLLLRDNWRSSYGWYDPYSKTSTPSDENGHGSHTMATIAGNRGYGVAPGSTWIACKGCNSRTCGASQLLACGQWIQCPTNTAGSRSSRRCDLAPDIVSNSWGGSGGSSWYDDVLRSWRESGIIPVVSIGNSGPNCNTAGTPGDRPNVIGVGSTESDDTISSFSSLGPASDGRVKPDISAPGGSITSAWYTSDRALNTISGTSMACPHVSGVIALMMEKNPALDYDDAYNGITRTAVSNMNPATSCGSAGRNSWPNNVFGYGRIDAVNSVNAA